MSKKFKRKKTQKIGEFDFKSIKKEQFVLNPKDAKNETFIITRQKNGKIKIIIKDEKGD